MGTGFESDVVMYARNDSHESHNPFNFLSFSVKRLNEDTFGTKMYYLLLHRSGRTPLLYGGFYICGVLQIKLCQKCNANIFKVMNIVLWLITQT